MTITFDLDAEKEAQLRERARREGENCDLSEAARMIVSAWLDWEAEELAASVQALREAEQAIAEGRFRPLSEYVAEHRKKYGYPDNWSPLANEKDESCLP